MPFNPDDKQPGNPLLSKDWNDHVHETIRLETAKVNRSGDTIAGDLTINGALSADASSQNKGGMQANVAFPGLRFGPIGSGEGLASQRAASGNPAADNVNGLDFYTNYTKRMSIGWTGNVGIGVTAPQAALDVNGEVHAVGTLRLDGSDRAMLVRQYDLFSSGAKQGLGRWGLFMESATLFLGVAGSDYAGNSSVRIGGWRADSSREDWMTISKGGNVGLGTSTGQAKLTIQQSTTDAGATAQSKALFVSSNMGSGASFDGGVEFRHDNLTQGIGFGYNTIYAAGSNADQELGLQSRGAGAVALNPGGGNVGINRNTAVFPLHFPSVLGDKITLWGEDPNQHYGLGIQGATLQIFGDAAGTRVAFGWGSSGNFHETMRIQGDGNLVVQNEVYLKNLAFRSIGSPANIPFMRIVCGANYDTPVGFTLQRPRGGNTGFYRMVFTQAFSMRPFGAVTQCYPMGDSPGGDTRDNAVFVNITSTYADVITGDSGGNHQDRWFTFFLIGW